MKPGTRLTINVDMDGVIYDFVEAMRHEFRWRGHDTPVPEQWSFEKAWGVSRDKFTEVMYEGILDGRVFGPGLDRVIPGAKEALQGLWYRDHHIRLVTHKSHFPEPVRTQAIHNTMQFLRVEGIRWHDLAFMSKDKLDYLADVVIDDKGDTTGWAQDGALNILMDQPWNQVIEQTPALRVVRAYGWDDAYDRILEEAEAARWAEQQTARSYR